MIDVHFMQNDFGHFADYTENKCKTEKWTNLNDIVQNEIQKMSLLEKHFEYNA